MAAPPAPVGEDYLFQFVPEVLNVNSPNSEPLYLTSNGEGKQLTVEKENINQQWTIQTLPGENRDSRYRTIVPFSMEPQLAAVSQDVVEFPDKVSLIKNLQVWSFIPVSKSEPSLYELQSNLYADVSGMDPLLSASVDSESKVLKAIIQKIPVISMPPIPRPIWRVMQVDKKK